MCLLIFKPAGLSVPENHLIAAANGNPHGSGIAIATGNEIIIHKDPAWRAKEITEILKQNEQYPAIIHFRFATHGSKTVANTHPFILNNDWVAAHNGVISISTEPDESDTRAFLRKNVIPIIENGYTLTDKEILAILSEEMGKSNKMTFLHKNGEYGIANEASGHWKDGVWYSNHGYMHTCHYGDWEDDDMDWSYHGAYQNHNTQYFDYRTKAPKAPVPPRFSAFGKVIEDDDSGSRYDAEYDNRNALMVLPDKVNQYNEKWHIMDTLNTVCDSCHQEIWGKYAYESTEELYVCEECCKFLPASLGIPRSMRMVDTVEVEVEQ